MKNAGCSWGKEICPNYPNLSLSLDTNISSMGWLAPDATSNPPLVCVKLLYQDLKYNQQVK